VRGLITDPELIFEAGSGAGNLSEGVHQWHDRRERLSGDAVVDVDTRDGIPSQNILQDSLAQDNTDQFGRFTHLRLRP
jgi:hypothetical protein